ncbi:MAG: hypothetical protein ACOYM1_04750 [Methylovulum sp.]
MIAIELNINVTTLKRPKDWPPEERLNALHETYSLTGDDLNAWCRVVSVVFSRINWSSGK